MHAEEEDLVSELVHCVEEAGRSWHRLYELANRVDSSRELRAPETHWVNWLHRFEEAVRRIRTEPQALSEKEKLVWDSAFVILPGTVPDHEVDEVNLTVEVKERLTAFWSKHVPDVSYRGQA